MAEQYTIIPLSSVRKIIAARMSEAKQTIPHYRLQVDIEVDQLIAARERCNKDYKERISVNDCIVKACARALTQHPEVNVQFVDGQIRQFADADISVIVATKGGLAAPIIRSANRKSIEDIARETRELASRALAGKLQMHEIIGGAFSISNLGPYGIDQFDAIINPPQCAILAVGRAKSIVAGSNESGGLRLATVLKATMSVDHRVIDGSVGAMFMNTLRQLLQEPQALFAKL